MGYGRVGIWALVVALLLTGCGGERRVPFAPSLPPQGGGSGGGSGAGGGDAGAGSGGGGSSTEPADGGTSSPPDDPTVTPTPGDPPGAGETWMEEGCATFDASRVYLELQTNSERETSALVELGSGDKHCIEFDKAATPRIRPTTGTR
jgi:hypothetical protein